MKNYILRFTLLCLIFAIVQLASAQTCTFTGSGNWPKKAGGTLATTTCSEVQVNSATTVIINAGVNVTINENVTWMADVIVRGTLILERTLALNESPSCNLTLSIESGGRLDDGGSSSANELLRICGITIIDNKNNGLYDWTQFPGGITGPATIDQSGGTLPIDLTSFEAQAIDNAVLITWATASEVNNDYFTLEKSKNGKDFVKFAQVAGSGTTSAGADYSYTDNNPSLGLAYYRLSQTDYDGTTEVFDAVSVVFTGKSNGMSVSPNPLRDQLLTIKSDGWTKSEAVVLKVYNLAGLLVAKKSFTADRYGNIDESFQLDRKLQKGLYLFELAGTSRAIQIKVVGE